jgi:predicted Zn-dependent protease
MYTREEARALVDRIVEMAAPDPVEVNLVAGERSGTRWANSSITVNLVQYNRQVTVTLHHDQRVGSANTRDFSDDGLRACIDEAREDARGSDPREEMPELLGPQEYIEVDSARSSMVGFGPLERAELVKASLDLSEEMGVVGYGYIPKNDQATCRANSNGLFAYFRDASTAFTLTCRTPDGAGSGWAGTTGIRDTGQIDPVELTRRASEKALMSATARAIEPGRYSVILEPRANARFLSLLTGIFGGGGGGGGGGAAAQFMRDRERGDKLFSDLFTLKSDIGNPILSQTTIQNNNRPAAPVTWVENGVLRNFGQGLDASPNMSLVMEGRDRSVEQMIAETRRGLLVSFFWYIRGVPATEQPLLNTGMTRDGLFLIENGEITGAVQNFRWNMSPIVGYNNLADVGRPEPMHMGESYDGGNTALIPPVRIEDFNMSSSSPAVE